MTQDAKSTLCVPQVAATEANMQKIDAKNMHCCGECKDKGPANHFKTELTPQVRQSVIFSQEIKKQTELPNGQFFYRMCVYHPFGFVVE